MNGLAVCAGVGGLELGLRIALGGTYRTVGYIEREAYAAATLVARMGDKALDQAPVWDDLSRFDGRPWRGLVDLVSSGIPCQPYSVAGAQRGHADERALWPELVRIVSECEPGLVFIENVPPFLKHAEPVWRELRRLGFIWAPPLLATASHVGAPHIRKRVFLLAAHPDRTRLERRSVCPCERPDERTARTGRNASSDTDGGGLALQRFGWIFDRERETFRNNSDRCSWPWTSESPVCRVDDGPPNRVDELRASGNAVVPLVAANAFRTLTESLSV